MKLSLSHLLLFIFLAAGTTSAQWVQTEGPEGGAIAALFQDGPNLYASTLGNAGVFKSTDGALTWDQKIDGMGYQSVEVIDRCGSYLLASGTDGLYRSTDDGDSWTTTTGLPSGYGVRTLMVDGANVFAATSGEGVYLSTDSGATWSAVNTGLPNSSGYTYASGIAKAGTGILASVTDLGTYGIYRTTDLGTSWAKVDIGLPAYTQLNALLMDGSTIYGTGPTVYKSTDDGVNWSEAGTGIPAYSGVDEIVVTGSTLFAAAFNAVFRSTDAGSTWTTLGGGLPLMSMVSLETAGSTVYAGTIASGVYASTDNGDTWAQRVSGLLARDMTNFFIAGPTLYGNGNGIFSTTNGGDIWATVRGDLKDSSAQPTLVYVDGATMFCRDYPATGIERSTDGGATWSEIYSGLPPFGTVSSMVSAGGALFTVNEKVYGSTDNGDTWARVDTALGVFVYMTNITKIGGSLFAYGQGIARSTDNGATWALADTGIPAFFGVTSVTVVGSTLFAGGGFPVKNYKSTDNGDTWTAIATLPSSSSASQLLGFGNDLFACGENNGIFISTNLGTSWTNISTGLPSPNFRYSLAIHNGMMYAGTSGNSVWKRPLSQVTAIEPVDSRVPAGYALRANYPNPFNPSTEIRFEVAGTEQVTLEVYDLLGRLVSVLVDGRLSPGTYSVSWNATGVPAGAYYLRMSAGAFSATGKMLFIK